MTLSTTSPDFEPVELKWTELKMCHSTYVGLFVLLLCLCRLFLVAWSGVCILHFSSVTTIFHMCKCNSRLGSSAYQPNKHNCNLARINLYSITDILKSHCKAEAIRLSAKSHAICFNYVTYPWAHVVRHSPLCNCNPLAQAVQFMRDTHCVHVCKHFAHTPASI